MRHEDFNMKEHGFVGHLAEPDDGSDRAVIVIMGGEQTKKLYCMWKKQVQEFYL